MLDVDALEYLLLFHSIVVCTIVLQGPRSRSGEYLDGCGISPVASVANSRFVRSTSQRTSPRLFVGLVMAKEKKRINAMWNYFTSTQMRQVPAEFSVCGACVSQAATWYLLGKSNFFSHRDVRYRHGDASAILKYCFCLEVLFRRTGIRKT